MIFGVSNDERLIGLQNVQDTSEKISEIIKTKMDPIPQVVLANHIEDGKAFIILRVLPGQETPYYYAADGNHIAYVHVGNESVPADAIALKRLVLRGTNMTYDSIVSSYRFQEFSFTKLSSVYRNRTGMELSDSDFISFELAAENGKLTNAGVLLADESPLKHSRLFCTRWYGLDKVSGVMEALDDKEYSGSLVSLLQNGMEFVKNNSKKRWKKTGTGRVEMPEYPEQAVHEALVNALIHRDYMEVGSEVHMDIFDDRMEIYSPGGMPDGSIVQNLDTDHVVSKRRNPVIADIFSRMHFMERRGSGFKKIKEDYHRAVNYRSEVEPLFQSTASAFFVTLYNLNYHVPIAEVLIDSEKVAFDNEKMLIDREKLLIQKAIDELKVTKRTKVKAKMLFTEMGMERIFGRREIMQMMNISITAAGNLLNNLKNGGLIEDVKGFGKGKYKFIKPSK